MKDTTTSSCLILTLSQQQYDYKHISQPSPSVLTGIRGANSDDHPHHAPVCFPPFYGPLSGSCLVPYTGIWVLHGLHKGMLTGTILNGSISSLYRFID